MGLDEQHEGLFRQEGFHDFGSSFSLAVQGPAELVHLPHALCQGLTHKHSYNLQLSQISQVKLRGQATHFDVQPECQGPCTACPCTD